MHLRRLHRLRCSAVWVRAVSAVHVVAADVGYGQLAWSLRADDRVVVHDRTNVRELAPELIGGPVEVVVDDVVALFERMAPCSV